MEILDKPIYGSKKRLEIAQKVGALIKTQGGNKVLCVFSDEEEFRRFLSINPQSARFIFPADNASTIRKHPRAEIVCLGAFWAHRDWDAIYRVIQEKTYAYPATRINWFPMGSEAAVIQSVQESARQIIAPQPIVET